MANGLPLVLHSPQDYLVVPWEPSANYSGQSTTYALYKDQEKTQPIPSALRCYNIKELLKPGFNTITFEDFAPECNSKGFVINVPMHISNVCLRSDPPVPVHCALSPLAFVKQKRKMSWHPDSESYAGPGGSGYRSGVSHHKALTLVGGYFPEQPNCEGHLRMLVEKPTQPVCVFKAVVEFENFRKPKLFKISGDLSYVLCKRTQQQGATWTINYNEPPSRIAARRITLFINGVPSPAVHYEPWHLLGAPKPLLHEHRFIIDTPEEGRLGNGKHIISIQLTVESPSDDSRLEVM